MKLNGQVKVFIERRNTFQGWLNQIAKIEGRSFLLRPGNEKIHVGDIVSDEIVDNELGIYDLIVEKI